ncbi:hypothetical protein FJM67_12765 [Maribrevibacterium harenarium]|uniref:Uncharacterized protein n=1 Tax=Maribrevibacterium harenarium TaxID=2589817 RepID=A0A501WKC7_9GAMM|nr:hypothetical protein [Maribrevibacterium harenarium]TPE48895.1 hypothetical protein FJM67_12765 [Maribrevibacterium harenarium]
MDQNEVLELNFYDRPEDEQQDFLAQTWCNQCLEVDLGMVNPREYRSEDRHWIVGDCARCGNEVITEIVYEDDE